MKNKTLFFDRNRDLGGFRIRFTTEYDFAQSNYGSTHRGFITPTVYFVGSKKANYDYLKD